MTRRRPRNAAESLHNTRRSLGDGTIAGRSRIATPYVPGSLKSASRTVAGGNPPVGEHVTLLGTTTVPSSGAFLQWDSRFSGVVHAGFTELEFTTDELTVEQLGYYDLHLDLQWINYREGGTVIVYINDTVAQEFVSSRGSGGRVVVPLGVLRRKKDVVKVWVEPNA